MKQPKKSTKKAAEQIKKQTKKQTKKQAKSRLPLCPTCKNPTSQLEGFGLMGVAVCPVCAIYVRQELLVSALIMRTQGSQISPALASHEILTELGFNVEKPVVLGVDEVNNFLRQRILDTPVDAIAQPQQQPEPRPVEPSLTNPHGFPPPVTQLELLSVGTK